MFTSSFRSRYISGKHDLFPIIFGSVFFLPSFFLYGSHVSWFVSCIFSEKKKHWRFALLRLSTGLEPRPSALRLGFGMPGQNPSELRGSMNLIKKVGTLETSCRKMRKFWPQSRRACFFGGRGGWVMDRLRWFFFSRRNESKSCGCFKC